LEEAENDYEKTGAIKAFEFCYELSWKTLKKVLEIQGKEVNNPRDTFRLVLLIPKLDLSLVKKEI
jgi:hypothetical protein